MNLQIRAAGRHGSIHDAVGFISFKAQTQREIEFLTKLADVFIDGGRVEVVHPTLPGIPFIFNVGGLEPGTVPRPERSPEAKPAREEPPSPKPKKPKNPPPFKKKKHPIG